MDDKKPTKNEVHDDTKISLATVKNPLVGNGEKPVTNDTEEASAFIRSCYDRDDLTQRKLVIFANEIGLRGTRLRKDTTHDVQNLKETFETMGFEVSVYKDLTYLDLVDVLVELQTANMSTVSCLAVVVLSSGTEWGYLNAKNQSYAPQMLWYYINSNHTLAGKPKLFFLQGSRGNGMDAGITVSPLRRLRHIQRSNTDPRVIVGRLTYEMAIGPDILVMFETLQGYASWRTNRGSFFIEILCERFRMADTTREDLVKILIAVNRCIAFQQRTNQEHQQLCTITSTLRSPVYFPKHRTAEQTASQTD